MLSIEEGKDYEDVDEANLPYTLLRNLGHGHSGNVEAVRDEMTNAVFARKIIYTPQSRLDKQELTKAFQNEVKIIRALGRHPHIVSVFATYITKRYFGLILQPVASDGDLKDFLGEYRSLNHELGDKFKHDPRRKAMNSVIQKAFGCLAVGLAFMHKKKVRHKDIKPRNILIHNGFLLYTDFGYSFDSNGFSQSTTEGRPAFLTSKYSAPEVLGHKRRNSKSDVFSLGCVFIDLFFALMMKSDLMYEVKNYSDSMSDIHKLLESIRFPPNIKFSLKTLALVEIIKKMTMRDDFARLCATHVANKVLDLVEFSCLGCQSTSRNTWSGGNHQNEPGKNGDLFQEQNQEPRKCCVEADGHLPAPEPKRQPQIFFHHEEFTSKESILMTADPNRTQIHPRSFCMQVCDFRKPEPFVVDKFGMMYDTRGEALGILQDGIQGLTKSYTISSDGLISDKSGQNVGRYEPNYTSPLHLFPSNGSDTRSYGYLPLVARSTKKKN